MTSSRWYESRRAKDGRKFSGGHYHGYVVGVAQCDGCKVCEGYEVCAIWRDNGSSIPLWPVLSCKTQAEAIAVAADLRGFIRANGDDEAEVSKRYEEWLTGRGWTKRNYICWSQA